MTESSPYVLGAQITAEGERLLQQCRGLEREARWLLDRVGVQPGTTPRISARGVLLKLGSLGGREGRLRHQ